MKHRAPALLMLLATASLTACGGGTNNGNQTPSLTTQLAACTTTSASTDPSASNCLAATYTGKTASGATCTVTIQQNGNYSFSTPALEYSFNATTQSVRSFTHTSSNNTHNITWSIKDPDSLQGQQDTYALLLNVNFASGASQPSFNIQGTKRTASGTTTSENCLLNWTNTNPGTGGGNVSTSPTEPRAPPQHFKRMASAKPSQIHCLHAG